MADRPILFSAPMVRAIISEAKQPGTGKTQTRRVLKAEVPPSPGDDAWLRKSFGGTHVDAPKHAHPYLDSYRNAKRTSDNPGAMSENWCWWTRDDRQCLPTFRVRYVPGDRLWVKETWADDEQFGGVLYRANHVGDDPIGNGWRPSMFMPRKISRLTLAVTAVRIERLQDITVSDAIAEGCGRPVIPDDLKSHPLANHIGPPARNAFAALWERINGETGAKSWEANPWVVAITFNPVLRNIDAMDAVAA